MYDKIEDAENLLIAEIQIHEVPQENGQQLNAIRFRLPIIDGETSMILGKCDGVENVGAFVKGAAV